MYKRHGNNLEIDVSDVATEDALHELLFRAFAFPDYYGRNWDAFDECVRDVEVPPNVTILGLPSLRQRLPREAELFERCLRDFIGDKGGRVTLHAS